MADEAAPSTTLPPTTKRVRVTITVEVEGGTVTRIEREAQMEPEELTRRLNGVFESVTQEMIPVCAWCHGIRGADQIWRDLATHLQDHLGRGVTHGICPTCMEKTRALAAKEVAEPGGNQ